MFIRLEIAKDGDFYRVNSAFPVRQADYEDRRDMKKSGTGANPRQPSLDNSPHSQLQLSQLLILSPVRVVPTLVAKH